MIKCKYAGARGYCLIDLGEWAESSKTSNRAIMKTYAHLQYSTVIESKSDAAHSDEISGIILPSNLLKVGQSRSLSYTSSGGAAPLALTISSEYNAVRL